MDIAVEDSHDLVKGFLKNLARVCVVKHDKYLGRAEMAE